MKFIWIFILTILLECCYASIKRQLHNHYNRQKRTLIPESFVIKSTKPYNGGHAKSLVRILAPNQQRHIQPDYKPPIPHLLPWKTFSEFFLGGPNQHLNHKINYDPSFIMRPRQSGILHSLEKSDLYQKLASYCVDWNPDAYSYFGFLCSGITDFGINLFIEAISFKDLIICAMIGYASGDSLFCLTWYLTRFFFRDYLPVGFKEAYDYEDGRLRQAI